MHLSEALGVHVRLRKRDEVVLVALGAEEIGRLGAPLGDVPEEDLRLGVTQAAVLSL